ncbi:MAG TPA: TonB-dependent receptor [Caulobacteraceae bacterium]|jgi:outer membrane receptor protein involved in Fe transport
MKSGFMVSCAAGALLSGLAAGAAFAADATVTDTAGATGIQEVVVTAQRRDETVQNVSMTVQALSSESIAKLNITDVEQILRFTPNVVYSAPGAGQGQISMRGLSTGRAGEQSYATVGNFPNVAIYLDEQSMQFPGRTPDIYLSDMQRVEVLEGPQGTLFGGGAEAGAIRYITNKPRMNIFEGNVDGTYGITWHGDSNYAFSGVVNLPLVQDKLAARVVVYNDRQGGYIDNVPSTFTRNEQLDNNTYIGVKPTGGLCPDSGKPNPNTGFCLPANSPQANNFSVAGKDQNPVTNQGARGELLWQINPDWDLLISQSVQNLDAEGLSTQYPVGSDFQKLQALQVTAFVPTYNKDNFESTAWTLNGKFNGFSALYTGSYTDRHITQQNDYTNYSRTLYGQYYECTGGNNSGFGAGKSSGPVVPAKCYSPVTFWHDKVHNTHMSHEARVSTPSDLRIRGIAGVYYEQFRINDVMDFNYKTIPSCDEGNNLAAALAGGATCVGNDAPAPGSTQNQPGVKGDMVGYGDDTTRGYDQTAAFVQVDFDIIPKMLTVTAGTRYYDYNEFEKGSIYHTPSSCTNTLVCGPKANIDAENLSVTYTGFKSHFGLQYKPTKDLMFYAVYSEGYRPGGFNRYPETKGPFTAGGSDNQFTKPVAYAPDSLKNYEAGVKSELLDHRLQLNLTGYHMEWTNSQIALYQPCCLGNSTFTTNGASYSIDGVEGQFIVRVLEGLTVQGSASYNENKQTNSPCLVSNAVGSPTLGKCITQVKGAPYPNPFGVEGGMSAFSPMWQANIGGRYEWTMNEYKPFVSLNANYTSQQFNEPENYIPGDQPSQIVPTTTYLRYKIPGYGTVDGSIGFVRDRWTVSLIGQNLLDSHAITLASSGQFIKAEVPLRPRVVNLKVSMHF